MCNNSKIQTYKCKKICFVRLYFNAKYYIVIHMEMRISEVDPMKYAKVFTISKKIGASRNKQM